MSEFFLAIVAGCALGSMLALFGIRDEIKQVRAWLVEIEFDLSKMPRADLPDDGRPENR